MNEVIVIGMPLKNNAATLRVAVESVLRQKSVSRDLLLLIANDSVDDDALNCIQDLLGDNRLRVVNVSFGKVHAVRNFIRHYVKENIPNCCLLGRLDADDILADEFVMSTVEKIWEKHQFDVLMMGNRQRTGSEILEWENIADQRLIDNQYLLERLESMSKGVPRAELPSCNTFVRPDIEVDYPAISSAEDHWFTVMLLLKAKDLKIHLAEDVIYSIYSLDGSATKQNREQNAYFKSRLDLLKYYKQQIGYEG